MKSMLQLTLLAFILTSGGCTSHKIQQTQRLTTVQTNGVTVVDERTTSIKARTLWDGENNVAKIKTTNTEKTQSVGQEGFNNSSSGTNAVRALQELNGILNNLKGF